MLYPSPAVLGFVNGRERKPRQKKKSSEFVFDIATVVLNHEEIKIDPQRITKIFTKTFKK